MKPPISFSRSCFPAIAAMLALFLPSFSSAAEPWRFDFQDRFSVELTGEASTGEASIREHAIAWHPVKRKYYLIADVVPLANPHHPNTYDTELYLWSSPDLRSWTFHGLAVPKGTPGEDFDGFGVASPAGMAYLDGHLYVPYSARKTAGFTQRGIGLACSSEDPEQLPWTKLAAPISDLPGEDDDAAALAEPDGGRLHVYHRTTGEGGYRIVHTSSPTPTDARSWPPAEPVTARPETVRAQELTGAAWFDNQYHLFVIEHLTAGGIRIAHLTAARPAGPFQAADENERYLQHQTGGLAYGGHFTPVVRGGRLEAAFWTAGQRGARYGLLGHPVVEP